MKKEIKYKDYRIGRDVYTVKMTYVPYGGITNGPAVDINVMEWHLLPRKWWEKLTEFWKYNLSTWTWDPAMTEASLDAYCIFKCHFETAKRIKVKRCDEEWEAI